MLAQFPLARWFGSGWFRRLVQSYSRRCCISRLLGPRRERNQGYRVSDALLDRIVSASSQDTYCCSIVCLAKVTIDTACACGVDNTAILLFQQVWPSCLGDLVGASKVDC